jgi:colanic acid/amylovoran biosynthesis glycosyltransferase
VPEIGLVSETFIQWDIHHLLPCGTVVVADPPPAGESVLRPRAWDTDGIPTLAFDPLPGDPPPSATRIDQVVGFLPDHGVEVGLIQYLDFADRWFDHLAEQGMGVWIRGHGVDLSARPTEAGGGRPIAATPMRPASSSRAASPPAP